MAGDKATSQSETYLKIVEFWHEIWKGICIVTGAPDMWRGGSGFMVG